MQRYFAKGTRQTGGRVRTLVLAPVEGRAGRLAQALAREDIAVRTVSRVREAIAALLEEEGPRPQLLVVDLDALDAGEILELHRVREEGWCGAICALGHVPAPLCASLKIDHVLADADERRLLRIAGGFEAATRRIPVFTTSRA